MDATTLKARLDAAHYICDDSLVVTLLVALQLGRPLLIEGAAGVGKTEIAKVMANYQSHSTSNPCSISQEAARAAMTGPQDCVEAILIYNDTPPT